MAAQPARRKMGLLNVIEDLLNHLGFRWGAGRVLPYDVVDLPTVYIVVDFIGNGGGGLIIEGC